MPELPEVENVRRGLEEHLPGQRILSVKVLKPKLVSGRGSMRPASRRKKNEFEAELAGEKFSTVSRRAKNLIFKFDSGKLVVAHLKMSGQFMYRGEKRAFHGSPRLNPQPLVSVGDELPGRHTRIIFELEDGSLFYNDMRMFGYLLYYPSQRALEESGHFEDMGVEPLSDSFTFELFVRELGSRKARIKSVFMDQSVVAGIGNIYADEILFRAGVHPEKKASEVSEREARELYMFIKKVISRAVELKGSTIRDYILSDGSEGRYAKEHKVYGKAGESCPKCGAILRKTIIASRSTVFCRKCQK